MHSLGVSLESDCLMATPSAILFRHDNALSTSRVDIFYVSSVMFYVSWNFRMSCVMGIKVLGNDHFRHRPAPSLSTPSPFPPQLLTLDGRRCVSGASRAAGAW